MKKKRRIYYEVRAVGESEVYRFYKYERMLDFVSKFYPRWVHKLYCYKIVGDLRIVGKLTDNPQCLIVFQ